MIFNNGYIRILESSDWHLGHDKTPTENVTKGIFAMLPDDGSLADLDLCIIAGDVFDHDLYYHSPKVRTSHQGILHALKMAKKYDFILFVIEGTPGHDWKQSISFTELNEIAEIGAEVHYIQTVEIVHIDKYDIDILVVPDEWRTRTEDTWKDVQACLKRHNLKKVHYSVMHGCFPHQLPGVPEGIVESHNPDHYLRITERFIFIGHIHTSSQYKRIIASGSLDAIAHGEEHRAKGWVEAKCYPDAAMDTVTFIKNPHAMPYKTIELTGLAIQTCIDKVEAYMAKVGYGHIRIAAKTADPANNYFALLKKQHPHYHWTFKDVSEKSRKDRTAELLAKQRQQLTLPKLTRANLEHLVLDRIKETRPDIIDQCRTILCEVLK